MIYESRYTLLTSRRKRRFIVTNPHAFRIFSFLITLLTYIHVDKNTSTWCSWLTRWWRTRQNTWKWWFSSIFSFLWSVLWVIFCPLTFYLCLSFDLRLLITGHLISSNFYLCGDVNKTQSLLLLIVTERKVYGIVQWQYSTITSFHDKFTITI